MIRKQVENPPHVSVDETTPDFLHLTQTRVPKVKRDDDEDITGSSYSLHSILLPLMLPSRYQVSELCSCRRTVTARLLP